MKPRILDLSHSQLVELIGSLGEPKYRADQILKWTYGGAARSFDDMTDLPQAFRQKLAEACHLFSLEPVDGRLSKDGQTRKVLFQLEDGKTIESAYMLYEPTETSRERRTVCVSTQVGCSIRCPFCATGQQGFERSLTAGEIVGTRDGLSVRLPAMEAVPITLLDHRWFASSLLEYPRSGASVLVPRGPESLSDGFVNEVAAVYAPDTAGNVAATDSLARLIGEKDFTALYHEGEKDNLHLSVVGGKIILVVIFDMRSSLGLVRLRVKKYSGELAAALERMQQRSSKARSGRMAASSPFAEITDEDIDSLFGN